MTMLHSPADLLSEMIVVAIGPFLEAGLLAETFSGISDLSQPLAL